jgi:hypothetical protein
VGIGALLVGGVLILLWVRPHDGRVALARGIAEAPERAVPKRRTDVEPRVQVEQA